MWGLGRVVWGCWGVKVVCMSAYELEPLNGLYRNTYVENCIYTCAGLDSKKGGKGDWGRAEEGQ